ncbi:MAG: amino acid permease [Chlamydiia bacterium]|nr:amino acid permease [Chlamydiia bacterium]
MKKLSFRALVSLVIGSQIGSGVFLLPASLAILGPISLFGWLISGVGAILLALVFSQLSLRLPQSGGPHVYMERAFGKTAAFYTAWTYWVVSWMSSIAVILAAVGYLSSMISIASPAMMLLAEILIITTISLINMRGAGVAGSLELFLTILKCLPLIVIPIAGLFYLRPEYFAWTASTNTLQSLNTASLMTFWGFIGLESATVTAGIIENPSKAIPRAVIMGTIAVAAIYFLNSIGIMGIIDPQILAHSSAPYVDAAHALFGLGWHTVIACIAFIVCIGTLNAWVLTSGQMAKEAGTAGLFPSIFGKTNRFGAPYVSLSIALCCTLPLLCLTLTPNILHQLNEIIDISVTIFLFVYLGCSCAFLKILSQEKGSLFYRCIGWLAVAFCVWALSYITLKHLAIGALFLASGLPIYLWQERKKRQQIIAS